MYMINVPYYLNEDLVMRLPQLNIAFLRISVLVPSSTTGSISTPASRASVKAPALKRCISPSFERVPSGKTATEAPREIHSLPSRTICSSASEARPRLMQMSPWRMRYCPKKGVLKTSRLETQRKLSGM